MGGEEADLSFHHEWVCLFHVIMYLLRDNPHGEVRHLTTLPALTQTSDCPFDQVFSSVMGVYDHH